jgi:hypothetical protein
MINITALSADRCKCERSKLTSFEFCSFNFTSTRIPNMVGVIVSDGEEDARIQRLQHKLKPTAALLEHSETAALPSQQRRIEEFHAAEAARCAAEAARRAAEIQSAINQVRAQPQTDQSESPCTPSAGPSVPTSPSPSLHTSDAPEK